MGIFKEEKEAPLYRTLMFVPGNQQRRLDKVKSLQSDAVILDLEDSVPLHEKESARSLVRQTLLGQHAEQVCFVRINDITTPFLVDDLESVVVSSLRGIMLPKADGRDSIFLADYLLTHFERKNGIDPGKLEIIPLIESASGVQHSYEIASACKRVKRLAFGSVDYALDVRAELTDEGTETLLARSQLVVASRSAGIEPPIDAVYFHINDTQGLSKSAEFAKKLGYQGKLVVHPNQIETVHQAFTPSEEEIEQAERIVQAFAEAQRSGLAAIQLDGKMIDIPVVERAKKMTKFRKS